MPVVQLVDGLFWSTTVPAPPVRIVGDAPAREGSYYHYRTDVTQYIEVLRLPRPSAWDRLLTEEPFRWGMLGDGGNKVELERALEESPLSERKPLQVQFPLAPPFEKVPLLHPGQVVPFREDFYVVVKATNPYDREAYTPPTKKERMARASQEAVVEAAKCQRRTKQRGPHSEAPFLNRPIVGFQRGRGRR